MSCYISSNNNRVYAALESSYGQVAAITGQNRIPLLRLNAKQTPVTTGRKDKTGTRTFIGLPNRIRKTSTFELSTPMTEWTNTSTAPSHGPLFQAALGAAPQAFGGGTVQSITNQTQLQFAGPHGLAPGQAITNGGEIRFVTAVQNTTTLFINAPFSFLTGGATVGNTMTYAVANDLSSVTLYDYWDPSTAVQRILNGAAMDKVQIKVNGDFHQFDFSGPARDVMDSASFTSGEANLTQFPSEPSSAGFDYTIVPGHLGQVWMGATPVQFFTLTSAELTVQNNISLRLHEFGSDFPVCIQAGAREVSLNVTIFEQDDAQTKQLYQAARQRSPISVMIQLGEQSGQLFAAYMPAMVPEVPQYDDQQTRLQWKFQNSRAQGTANDELYVAFG
ncbi:MAG: hypothetical protein JO307_25380 [Bryobacterales bacterium]|nr:hypothetical protein [Bryobacterales bacterium]MBV9397574.1 hypothetical protein [Bryobacterales bacterium]